MTPTARAKHRHPLTNGLFELDRILRGEATRPADIQLADIRIPILGISAVIGILAIIYGFCMGVFALVHGVENSDYGRALLQTFASMTKVPLLFMLTLLVTFPSLYVFNALVGSQLRIVSVLKLLIASLGVNLAVLASMGPILAFFSVSTPNYSFIVLLNVLIFSIAGVLGLSFLVQTLNRLTHANRGTLPATTRRLEPRNLPPATQDTAGSEQSPLATTQTQEPIVATLKPAEEQQSTQTGPLDRLDGIVLGSQVRQVFICWIVVFGLVGAQMGWVLRPFIGSPDRPFEWFRTRESNFFEAVWNTFQNLFS